MADDNLPRDPLRREAAILAAKPVRPARPFIHLRVHSAYSLLEGALQLGKIVSHAVKDECPAIAVTDTNNLFGALEFAQKAVKDGVQPIIGCQVDLAFSGENSDGQRDRRRQGPELRPVVLIAANEVGYANLVRMVSRVYLETPPGEPVHLSTAMMEGNCEGLICLTGGPRGPLGNALKEDRRDLAEARLLGLKELFGDGLYVELERVGAYDRAIELATIELAYGHELPLVATNEAFFSARSDYEAHDALIAIAEGSVVAADNRRRLSPDNFLKSQAEMATLFADLPEAIDNTVEIALRCSYYPKNRAPILPRFTGGDVADAAAAVKAEAEELARQAWEGLEARLATHGSADGHTVEEYRERLAFELGIIERMQFPGYFLIVADFIKWAKAQGIPVGPGRGSGAGSLVAYALTITDIDPLRFSLLFERFLNPERVSMPDFDIDFCQDRREEVIRYVQARLRARPGRADHHLRYAAGARRAARRRSRTPDALRPGRPAVQDGARQPGQPGQACRRHRGRAALCRGGRARADRPDAARHGAEARRALPPRLDPRRRHRHRRPAAVGTGADVPRPALRHAGHAVQHEICRAGRAGEVRLPRPEDADGTEHGGEADRAGAASTSISRPYPARRSPTPIRCCRAAKWSACSRWKGPACARR